ncbi:Ferric enterobactin receptor [compost metagenome]
MLRSCGVSQKRRQQGFPVKKNRIALAVSAVLMGPTVAAAQVVDAPEPLQEVVVSAKSERGETPAIPPNTPSPAYGISSRRMADFNVVNTEDALKYAPNLAVRKRFIGDMNSIISVRSTSSRQSARGLVYADGLLLSNLLGSDFSFPPRWSLVNSAEIERMDVLYGPYSALYPGNSLGATVLITTRTPEKFEGDASVQLFTQRFSLYGTHDNFNGVHANAYVDDRVGPFSWLVSVDRQDSKSQPLSFYTAARSTARATSADKPVTGAHFDQDQTGRDRVVMGVNSEGVTHTVQDQLKLKLGYDITNTLQAQFTAAYWQQDRSSATGSYLRDASGNVVSNGPVNIGGYQYVIPANAFAPSNGEDARWLYGLSLRTRNETGWNFSGVASLFDVSKDISRSANTAGNGPGTVTYGDGTGWRTLDLKADYRPQQLQGGHWVTFGYHYDNYRLTNTTYNTSDWQAATITAFNNAFAGKTETQALYAQDAWYFAEDWKLIPGVRYEHWRAYDGSRSQPGVDIGYPVRGESNWSPKLALEKAFGQDWLGRLSLGQAYRYPTVSELFQGRITGTALINNDPNLRPERSFSKDLTFERTLDSSYFRVSVYEDDIRDALVSQTNTTVFPTVTSFQNVDRVRTRGIELAYDARDVFFSGFDLSASGAYNHSKTLENANNPASVGKYFYRIPKWRANLMGTYRITPAWAGTLAMTYSGRQYNTLDNSDVNPDTFGGTSSFLTFDVKLTYRPAKNVRLGLGIDNLTDQRYYVYHPYPGRTFYAEAKLSF